MEFFKRKWKDFVEYVLSNKKNIIFNYIVFIITITILLIIDLVTKTTLFDPNNLYVVKHSNWLFGIRSVENSGLTFASFTNIGLITFLNVMIWIICLFGLIFLRSYWFAIFIGFIFAGSLGNTIDRLAYGYVRDIIYLPWCDKGTFNFADVDVIVGCVGLLMTMVIQFFLTNRKA